MFDTCRDEPFSFKRWSYNCKKSFDGSCAESECNRVSQHWSSLHIVFTDMLDYAGVTWFVHRCTQLDKVDTESKYMSSRHFPKHVTCKLNHHCKHIPKLVSPHLASCSVAAYKSTTWAPHTPDKSSPWGSYGVCVFQGCPCVLHALKTLEGGFFILFFSAEPMNQSDDAAGVGQKRMAMPQRFSSLFHRWGLIWKCQPLERAQTKAYLAFFCLQCYMCTCSAPKKYLQCFTFPHFIMLRPYSKMDSFFFLKILHRTPHNDNVKKCFCDFCKLLKTK